MTGRLEASVSVFGDHDERIAAVIAAVALSAGQDPMTHGNAMGVEAQGYEGVRELPAAGPSASIWAIASRQMGLDRNRRVYERSRGRQK